jgi:hypothetical protein
VHQAELRLYPFDLLPAEQAVVFALAHGNNGSRSDGRCTWKLFSTSGPDKPRDP